MKQLSISRSSLLRSIFKQSLWLTGLYLTGIWSVMGLLGMALAQSDIRNSSHDLVLHAKSKDTPQIGNDTARHITIGNIQYNKGRFDSAYIAFKKAVDRDPKNKAALLGLGRSQIKIRYFSDAIQTLNQLVTLDPRSVSGHIALAHALQQQYVAARNRKAVKDNLNKALVILNKAEGVTRIQQKTRKNISLSKVYNERGYIYSLQGELPKAAKAYEQAAQFNPKESLILYNLGEIYAQMGQTEKALTILQKAVIMNPEDAYNRAYYARLLANSGQFDAAKPEAAEAAKMAPKNAYTVGQFGVVSYLAHEPALARINLNQAVKLAPLKYPEFYYFLGRIDLDSRDFQAARAHLTKAVVLGSTKAEYAYYLGLAYEQSGSGVMQDKVKARKNYQRAIELDPHNKLAKEGLKRLKKIK